MTDLLAQPVAVVTAIAAAICFAIANVLQQRVAAQLPSTKAFDTGVLIRLAHSPMWIIGFVAVIFSISLQAAALGLGRLVVVEPVLASSLLVTLALAAWAERRPMRAGEWAAAIATFAGLAVFLVASEPSSGSPTANAGPLALASVGAFLFAGIATVVAIRLSPVRRALALGIGGGVAAGVTDALTKSVAFLAGSRELGVFADPRLYLLIVVGLMTYTIQQNGYRAASLAAFLPAFAVLDPVVGSVLGLSVYHERLDGGAIRIGIEALAVTAATWGITRLAKYSAQPTAQPVAEPAAVPAATPTPEPGLEPQLSLESEFELELVTEPAPVPAVTASAGRLPSVLPLSLAATAAELAPPPPVAAE